MNVTQALWVWRSPSVTHNIMRIMRPKMGSDRPVWSIQGMEIVWIKYIIIMIIHKLVWSVISPHILHFPLAWHQLELFCLKEKDKMLHSCTTCLYNIVSVKHFLGHFFRKKKIFRTIIKILPFICFNLAKLTGLITEEYGQNWGAARQRKTKNNPKKRL